MTRTYRRDPPYKAPPPVLIARLDGNFCPDSCSESPPTVAQTVSVQPSQT